MRRGQHPLDPSQTRRLARLYQIHKMTHPELIAKRSGLTAAYIRMVWENLTVAELQELERKLEHFEP